MLKINSESSSHLLDLLTRVFIGFSVFLALIVFWRQEDAFFARKIILECDYTALRFYKQGTRFFVQLKITNRILDVLVDSGSTKSILGKEVIELAAEFN